MFSSYADQQGFQFQTDSELGREHDDDDGDGDAAAANRRINTTTAAADTNTNTTTPTHHFSAATFDDHHGAGFDELLLAIQLLPSSNMGITMSEPQQPQPQPPSSGCDKTTDMAAAAAPSTGGRKRGLRRDRHSKIVTAKGPRDRRMRLSLDVAKKFFYLQDVLGFDKASKTVDWLLTKSNDAIRSLTACAGGSRSEHVHHLGGSNRSIGNNGNKLEYLTSTENEVDSANAEIVVSHRQPKTSRKPSSSTGQTNRKVASNPVLVRESRAKARARARERTREKKIMSMTIQQQQQQQQQQQDHESNIHCDQEQSVPMMMIGDSNGGISTSHYTCNNNNGVNNVDPFSFYQEYAGNFHTTGITTAATATQEQEQQQQQGVLNPYFS